jgi:hypothetical protein
MLALPITSSIYRQQRPRTNDKSVTILSIDAALMQLRARFVAAFAFPAYKIGNFA